MASLCDIDAIQMEEEDSDERHLIGDFSKVSLVISAFTTISVCAHAQINKYLVNIKSRK